MSKLTENEIDNLRWAIIDKGDGTRWCDWDTRKKQVKKEFPLLYKAIKKQAEWEDNVQALGNNLEWTES